MLVQVQQRAGLQVRARFWALARARVQALGRVQVRALGLERLWVPQRWHRRNQVRQWQASKNCCASIRRKSSSRLHRQKTTSY